MITVSSVLIAATTLAASAKKQEEFPSYRKSNHTLKALSIVVYLQERCNYSSLATLLKRYALRLPLSWIRDRCTISVAWIHLHRPICLCTFTAALELATAKVLTQDQPYHPEIPYHVR
jgi:hypothetical protein